MTMAYSSTQSRPFPTLASATSPTLTDNNAAFKSTLGNGAGPWGSQTASIWGSGKVPNTLASRTSSSEKAPQLKPASAESTTETTAKKGSGSLLASSESDSWRPHQPRLDTRPALPAHALRAATMIEIPRTFQNGTATLSPTSTRPPAINLTNPTLTQNRSAYGSTHLWTNFGAEAPNVYPKNKDRQSQTSYTPADSVIDHSAATSPVTDRRPQWSSHYSTPSSVSASRETSRPPQQPFRADRQYSLPSAEYQALPGSHFHSALSPASRNGSVSSTYNLPDHLTSSFSALSMRQAERPSSARSLPQGTRIIPNDYTTNGHHEPGQETNEYLPAHQTTTTQNGMGHYGMTTQQQPSAPLSFSINDLQTLDARSGQYYAFPSTQNAQTYNHRPQLPWQDMATPPTTLTRRSTAPHDQQTPIDPRIAAQMMAIKGVYNFPSSFATGVPMVATSFQPFLNYYPAGLGSIPPSMPPPEVEQGLQSAKLYDFKLAGKNTRRYELKDIYDHIAEFAGDQHGSRFIQTKLETANSDEKEHVFREIEPNAIPLMTDVFGNYVIQKFFDHGHQEHKKILANKMRGQVLNLSTQMYGCRVVQKALEHVLLEQQTALVNELKHHVLKCVKDQNGNHVIQKVIERCSTDSISFVYEAFVGQVYSLSLHPYGCRVIQRCLERTEWFPAKPAILAELHEGVPKGMIGDSYGNYVVQHIVQNGPEPDRRHVLGIVLSDVEGYSKHKFASNVVEKCIEYSDDRWRRQVVELFTNVDHRRPESESILVGLIKDQYGNYVVQRLLDRLLTQDYFYFLHQLQPAMAHAKRTGSGKQVVSIEKKMQRFDFTPAHPEMFQPGNPQAMYAGQYASVNSTSPPAPTSEIHCAPSNGLPSVNGDAVEGATSMSRQGSEVASEHTAAR